jgi:hypothetical protein
MSDVKLTSMNRRAFVMSSAAGVLSSAALLAFKPGAADAKEAMIGNKAPGTVLTLGISKQRSYRMGHLTSDLPQGFIQRRQKKPSKVRLRVSSYPQLLWSCKKIALS